MAKKTFVYRDNTGGTNLRSNEAHLTQGEQGTEMAYIQNLEIYREGGFGDQKGNTQLNTGVTDATQVLGIGQFIDSSGNFYAIYTKASGKAYVMAATGGAETEIKTGLNASATPVFVQFNGKSICFNGSDTPWSWNGAAQANLAGTPAAWATTKPNVAAAHRGVRLFAAAGSTLHFCAAGNENDWTTANDAGSISDAFGDTTGYSALYEYGDRLVGYKKSRRVYTVTGTTFDTYAIVPVASNRASIGKYAVANINDNQFFFTGDEILPLVTTDLGIVKLGRTNEISYKIKPFFTGTEAEMPINPIIAANASESILIPYYSQNELIGYFKTTGNSDGFDTAAIFNFDRTNWIFRKANKVTAAALVNDQVLTGTSDGKILKEFTGSSLHNAGTFQRKILTPFFDFGLPHIEKSITRFYIWFKSSTNLDVTMNIKTNYSPDTQWTRRIQTSGQSSTATYGTGKYGTATYAASVFVFEHFPISLGAYNFQIELTSSVSTLDFRVVQFGFEIDYDQPK